MRLESPMLVQHAHGMGTQQGRGCRRRLLPPGSVPITVLSVILSQHPTRRGTNIPPLCRAETCPSLPCSPGRFVTIATFFRAGRAQTSAGLRSPSHFCMAGGKGEGLASRPGIAVIAAGMLWLQDSGHSGAMVQLVWESLNILQTPKLCKVPGERAVDGVGL